MGTRPPLFEILVERAVSGSRTAAATLHRQLRAAIVDGRLVGGSRLPAARDAQRVFGVSRNTAAEVYARLASEGYVVARRGSGTYVADGLPARVARSRERSARTGDPRLNAFWSRPETLAAIGFWNERDAARPPDADRTTIDFRPALVDSRLFPHDVYRRIVLRQSRGSETRPASLRSPQGNQGNLALREAVTRHIAVTRAVGCEADDVLVSAGAQQAFDILARALVTPGKTIVAIEEPGYPPIRVAFAAAGARLVPIAVDEEGLRVDRLPGDVGIVCVTPSHQFPLGVAMSPGRRRALVAFAREHGAVLVEDDYDGEFRLDGDPLDALRHLDAADVVFYVGTFSKCMLPALRLGFIVAPRWAMHTLVTVKNALDWHCPTLIQTSVATFIAEGHLARHIRAMREHYRVRRQVLLDLLREDFAAWLTPLPSFYGMHVSVIAAPTIDVEALARAVRRDGVDVHTLQRYFVEPSPRAGLVFGYGVVDVSQLRSGLASLRKRLSGPSISRPLGRSG